MGGDGPHLCEAPSGPFWRMGTIPFFRPFCLAPLGIFGLMADGASADTLRIMPLGDSITSGYTDSSWSNPFTFGYRGPLYTRLTNAG